MINAKDYFDVGIKFHGHKCPAMPLGLRAGAAAMNALGVERSQDKELVMVVETGNDHAAGCFVDGLMHAHAGRDRWLVTLTKRIRCDSA